MVHEVEPSQGGLVPAPVSLLHTHDGRTVDGRMVLVRCDNTSAVSYINRQGGTRSLTLWSMTWDLFQ